MVARYAACVGLILAASFLPVRADIWQWSVPVAGGRNGAGPAVAYLWIPPSCSRIRGVVVAQNNLEEIQILEHPAFRKAMSDLNFAEVWVSPWFDLFFRFNEGAGDMFNSMMNDLASESGYSELKDAPIVPIGHSAAASWPYYFAAWAPDRCLAALSVSGQWPYFRHPVFAPDIWGARNIDFIPSLETMGEYESAENWANEGLLERKNHPLMPLSMFAGPAQGHFSATDKKIDMLVLYIKKAVQYRMPAKLLASGPVKLMPIDPTKTGWLVERWHKDAPPAFAPAPVGQYKGDPSQAFWFFDEETAKAVTAYQADYRGLKEQLCGYVQDGKTLPVTNTHFAVYVRFKPGSDGITFHVSGTFLDATPNDHGNMGLPANTPVGHATGGGPVVVRKVMGPVERDGDDTFRLSLERGLGANQTKYGATLEAVHPGDAEYKPACQQADFSFPARNTQGGDQHITFPAIPNMKASAKPYTLDAVSDSGMPVSYYVESGPAVIDGNKLVLTAIPPRAKLPVKVTVVAWQYGRSIEPKVKSAAPVTQTFAVTR